MEPHQQIKWAGNHNVRLKVKWARNSLGYNQGVLSNLGNSLQLILRPSLAGHTHFQGEWVWVLWTAFRASLRNVRGSNLIGPFLTRHMTSCMRAVYIVLLSFLRTQRKVMMAARSRLSDFLRLLLETNFCSQLLEPSSLPKQLQQTIVEHSGTRETDKASGFTRESISLNVCVENSLCSCLP